MSQESTTKHQNDNTTEKTRNNRSLSSLSFREEIVKIVVDRLLIGLLLLLAGLLINVTLEKYKSEQSFNRNLSEKRLEVLSECWRLANAVDLESIELRSVLSDIVKVRLGELESAKDWEEDQEKRMEIEREISLAVKQEAGSKLSKQTEAIKKALSYVRENRFWLEPKEYITLEHFLTTSEQYATLMVLSWSEEVNKELLNNLDKYRRNLEDIRENLFKN